MDKGLLFKLEVQDGDSITFGGVLGPGDNAKPCCLSTEVRETAETNKSSFLKTDLALNRPRRLGSEALVVKRTANQDWDDERNWFFSWW